MRATETKQSDRKTEIDVLDDVPWGAKPNQVLSARFNSMRVRDNTTEGNQSLLRDLMSHRASAEH